MARIHNIRIASLVGHRIHLHTAETPDTITEGGEHEPVAVLDPTGTIARAGYIEISDPYVAPGLPGVELVDILPGPTTGLPAPAAGTLHLVSWPAAQAAPDRSDLIVNLRHVRDSTGREVGARRLGRVLPALGVAGEHRAGRATIIMGLPGSGKSYLAEQITTADPEARELCRDTIRDELVAAGYWHGTDKWAFDARDEQLVTAVQTRRMIGYLVEGRHVVVSDMNLRPEYVTRLVAIARSVGAEWELIDLTSVDIDLCVARDAARTVDKVGEDKIRLLAAEAGIGVHISTMPTPTGRIPGIIVDVDGTVARIPVDADGKRTRSPYVDGEHLVGADLPVLPVITAVRAMHTAGHAVIVTSGRTRGCEQETRRWLDEHLGVPYALHMRPVGDRRHDYLIKREIYIDHIHARYDVLAVFDDRDQVVSEWRRLGLTVFQVAEGGF